MSPPRGAAIHEVRYAISPDRILLAGTLTRLLRRLEPILIAAHGCDVLFAPNYFLPRRFALARGALVATIHDLGFRTVPWTLREETLEELGERLPAGVSADTWDDDSIILKQRIGLLLVL